jgi:hypothetical protein
MNLTYAIGSAGALADQLSWASSAGLIEALSLTFPSLALDLWRRRQRLASLACALISAGAIGLATWSNLDYIRQGSADHIVSRLIVADTREALRARIAIANRDRSAISEARSVDELSAAMARLRIAPWVSAETAGCTARGSEAADRQCGPLRRLIEARATAIHRNELDAALARDNASLLALPATSPASPSPLRIILFALVPGALAGSVLMLARW